MIKAIIDFFIRLFSKKEEPILVKPPLKPEPKPIIKDFEMQKDDPEWLKIAFAFIGLKEPDPMIEVFHGAARFNGTYKDSWCSSFLCYCFEKAKIESARDPGAKSWLEWGEKVDIPSRGTVCVFWRVDPNSWQGHVGLFIKNEGDFIWCLSGNSDNRVRIAAYPKNQLLGFRHKSQSTH